MATELTGMERALIGPDGAEKMRAVRVQIQIIPNNIVVLDVQGKAVGSVPAGGVMQQQETGQEFIVFPAQITIPMAAFPNRSKVLNAQGISKTLDGIVPVMYARLLCPAIHTQTNEAEHQGDTSLPVAMPLALVPDGEELIVRWVMAAHQVRKGAITVVEAQNLLNATEKEFLEWYTTEYGSSPPEQPRFNLSDLMPRSVSMATDG